MARSADKYVIHPIWKLWRVECDLVILEIMGFNQWLQARTEASRKCKLSVYTSNWNSHCTSSIWGTYMSTSNVTTSNNHWSTVICDWIGLSGEERTLGASLHRLNAVWLVDKWICVEWPFPVSPRAVFFNPVRRDPLLCTFCMSPLSDTLNWVHGALS